MIGTDESGEWLAVRDPRDVRIVRWLPAGAAVPDGEPIPVDVMECPAVVELVVEAAPAAPAPPSTTAPTMTTIGT